MQDQTVVEAPDWSGSSGDIWARRWRDTDRALSVIGASLDQAILDAAPEGPFRALDVGCGPGTTTLALAARRPDAAILGCDLSQLLIAIARQRTTGGKSVRYIAADAEQAAREQGPFELIYSRHGVMFFDDPWRAFRTFREASAANGRLVFSCFDSWERNAWAAELASAAAGRKVTAPGREPSGFAFSEPEYVRDILTDSGWREAEPRAVAFDYIAGEGPDAIDQAMSFLSELGPAARVVEGLVGEEREEALTRMRRVVARHDRDGRVSFAAAAWVWDAVAGD